MPKRQVIELRNRILGILIRNAREQARLSRNKCSKIIGVSESKYEEYEEGVRSITLPELELLGRYLSVPLHVLRDEGAQDQLEPPDMPDPEVYAGLRDRIIGTRLRKARLDADYTQEDIAGFVGHSSSTISAYEYGKQSIPLSELEVLTRELHIPMSEFLDLDSEIGIWHQRQLDFEKFLELPEDVREFVLRPINESYLELAMKLASMPAGALRQIAEGLLEITY